MNVYLVRVNAVNGSGRVLDRTQQAELYDAKTRALLCRRPTLKGVRGVARRKAWTIVDGPETFQPKR